MNILERVEKMRLAAKSRVRVNSVDSQMAKTPYEKIRLIENGIKNIPPRFAGKCFDDFKVDYPEQKKVKLIAERFVGTFDQQLMNGSCIQFHGAPGTGKTFLSLIMCQALAHGGFSVAYESSLQFIRDLHNKNFNSSAEFIKQLDTYKQIQFLIIDEATESRVTGKQLSSWEKEILFALIDMRYQYNLCTLTISNLSTPEFNDRIGERIASRLDENGLALAFNWNSYRK